MNETWLMAALQLFAGNSYTLLMVLLHFFVAVDCSIVSHVHIMRSASAPCLAYTPSTGVR
jgi:hypothetical protein